eukprot:c6084_g1_i1 orf=3-158(-)
MVLISVKLHPDAFLKMLSLFSPSAYPAIAQMFDITTYTKANNWSQLQSTFCI